MSVCVYLDGVIDKMFINMIYRIVCFIGGLLSYSMEQGGKRGENWSFNDNTYDGIWEGNYLTKGLGTLFDGREGPSDFKDDYYGHERGK